MATRLNTGSEYLPDDRCDVNVYWELDLNDPSESGGACPTTDLFCYLTAELWALKGK